MLVVVGDVRFPRTLRLVEKKTRRLFTLSLRFLSLPCRFMDSNSSPSFHQYVTHPPTFNAALGHSVFLPLNDAKQPLRRELRISNPIVKDFSPGLLWDQIIEALTASPDASEIDGSPVRNF